MMGATTSPPSPSPTATLSNPPSPRFTLELEFVLCLSNPYYLSHLALTYPHLLNPPKDQDKKPTPNRSSDPNRSLSDAPQDPEQAKPESDAAKFASYLAYLYDYWRRPEYARLLTHPGATLRNLELLQQERFRRDIIRPDVIERLLAVEDVTADPGGAGDEDRKGGDDDGRDLVTAAAADEGNGAAANPIVKDQKGEENQDVTMGLDAG